MVYLACAILIGVPLLTAEISLGRKSQLSPIAGKARLTGRSWMLAIGGLRIALYAAFVWGWTRFREYTNAGSGRVKVNPTCKPFVLVVVPVAFFLVLLGGLGT